MSEFFELFAQIYANLVLVDLDEYPEGDKANSFVYIVRDWLNGTEPETEDPTLTLALAVIEPAVNKLKEGKDT